MRKQLLSAVAGGRSVAAGGSGRSSPQPLMGAAGLVLLQPPHFITQARQLRSVRARVSGQPRGLS